MNFRPDRSISPIILALSFAIGSPSAWATAPPTSRECSVLYSKKALLYKEELLAEIPENIRLKIDRAYSTILSKDDNGRYLREAQFHQIVEEINAGDPIGLRRKKLGWNFESSKYYDLLVPPTDWRVVARTFNQWVSDQVQTGAISPQDAQFLSIRVSYPGEDPASAGRYIRLGVDPWPDSPDAFPLFQEKVISHTHWIQKKREGKLVFSFHPSAFMHDTGHAVDLMDPVIMAADSAFFRGPLNDPGISTSYQEAIGFLVGEFVTVPEPGAWEAVIEVDPRLKSLRNRQEIEASLRKMEGGPGELISKLIPVLWKVLENHGGAMRDGYNLAARAQHDYRNVVIRAEAEQDRSAPDRLDEDYAFRWRGEGYGYDSLESSLWMQVLTLQLILQYRHASEKRIIRRAAQILGAIRVWHDRKLTTSQYIRELGLLPEDFYHTASFEFVEQFAGGFQSFTSEHLVRPAFRAAQAAATREAALHR